jgi:Flp pilus assembly pilin Flp
MSGYVTRALTEVRTGDHGQTYVEYALILAAVSVAIALALTAGGLATALGNAVTLVDNTIGA